MRIPYTPEYSRFLMHKLVSLVEVAGFLAVLLSIAANAIYMLISPRAWFRLPRWFRKSGGLSEKRYSSGSGAIQIRILGAIALAITGSMLYAAFIRSR
jgi:hypothetical protein